MSQSTGVAAGDAETSFGDLLRYHRRLAELTQEELAERAGLSVRSISDLERGDAHVPRRDTINLIAHALDLDEASRAALYGVVNRRRGPRKQPNSTAELHNLPRQLTSFVGRQREQEELAGLLDRTPLLTLIGAGGVGKTRLALELARTQVSAFRDGVWLVELAGVDDSALLTAAFANVLGVVEHAGQPLERSLLEALQSRHTLLLVDNCEHLVEACAELIELVRTCPGVHVLATSREALEITGEVAWVVPPLGLPAPGAPLEAVASSAAVQLLVDRASAYQGETRVTEDTAADLSRVCRALDGLPLALELAAARLRAMSVHDLAGRLDTNLGLLASRTRTGAPHQHTLRATLQWSYDLLEEPERRLFHRLAVFAGSWSLDLAEAVCTLHSSECSDLVVDTMSRLVDKSMLIVESRTGAARYRMLEPIRQYALELLENSSDASALRARHAAVLVERAQRDEPQLSGPLEIASLDRLELDNANYRAALAWLVRKRDAASALRLSSALWRFWERRGHHREGCAWLDQVLAIEGDVPLELRGRALNAFANMLWTTGEVERAEPLAAQALAASSGDARGTAWALVNLGMIAYYSEDAERAIDRLERSLPPAREAADLALLSLALSSLGRVRLWAHGPSDHVARARLDESVEVARQAGSLHATSQALGGAAEMATRQGDLELAEKRWREALSLRWQLRDQRGIATALERLAQSAAAFGQAQRAAWLWGAADVRREAIGLNFRHDEKADHARLVAAIAANVDRSVFAVGWMAGRQASLEQVVGEALAKICSTGRRSQ
jgi:non-specific serine/threonine protein kinase